MTDKILELINLAVNNNEILASDLEMITAEIEDDTMFDEVLEYIEENYIIIDNDDIDDDNVSDAEVIAVGQKYFFRQIAKYEILSKSEELNLAKETKAGSKEARDLLILSNIRLVISIAKKYVNRGVELEDLISYGIIGLINAIDRFRPELGNKLSTHATWWIRQSITRAIADTSRTIRIPTSVSQRINAISRARRRLENSLMRDPTTEEIATELGWDITKVNETLRQGAPVMSYDKPIDDENKNEMLDIINIPGEPVYDEDMETEDLFRSFIELASKFLTEKELYVICARNAIGCEKQTLEAIGNKLGVTKQNIGQIQQNAAKKLRMRPDVLKFINALKS